LEGEDTRSLIPQLKVPWNNRVTLTTWWVAEKPLLFTSAGESKSSPSGAHGADLNHSSFTYLPTTPLWRRQRQRKICSASILCSFLIALRFPPVDSCRAIGVHHPLRLVPSPLFSWSPPHPSYSTLEDAIS